MDDGSLSTADQITGSPFVLVACSEPESEAVAVGSPHLAEYQNPLVVDSLADEDPPAFPTLAAFSEKVAPMYPLSIDSVDTGFVEIRLLVPIRQCRVLRLWVCRKRFRFRVMTLWSLAL